jgi:hypothetical protein
MGSDNACPGQKAQLHQPQGLIFRQIQMVQNAMFTSPKLGKRGRARSLMAALTFDTQLHAHFSIGRKARVVKVMEMAGYRL